MGITSAWHGYNNRYNNPVHSAHKNMGAQYIQQNTVVCHLVYSQMTP